MISLISDEIPDTPNRPDFLLRISVISLMSEIPVFSIKYGINDGSKSPERVPIMTPASGVKLIEVSMLLP